MINGGPVSQSLICDLNLWDVKEPTYSSKRVGRVVPGDVVYLCTVSIQGELGEGVVPRIDLVFCSH